MGAALLRAEREGWLSAGLSGLPEDRGFWPAICVSKQSLPIEDTSVAALGFAPSRETTTSAECKASAAPKAERCGTCPVPQRPRQVATAAFASLCLHLGVALAAFSLFPQLSSLEAERGGDPILDVLVIGSEEAEALLEGAKPMPASIVQVPTPEVQPVVPPPVSEPQPDIPQATAMPEPEPALSPVAPIAEQPTGESIRIQTPPPPPLETPLISPPVENRHVEAKRTEPAPIRMKSPVVAPKPKPVERKAKKVAPPAPTRAISEARGEQGEGRAAANRLAQSRGGTGGRAEAAGNASMTSFRSRLVAHLTRYKSYPEQAYERGITGRNSVTLTLSREGRVLSASLYNASGQSLLDGATLAAVRRAQPFPAIPESGPTTFTVTIGINYDLR